MITRIVENTSESIRKTCEVLGVARSSFYEARTPSARRSEDDRLGNIIESIFREHRRRYGYRRIHSEMIDRKEFCTQERVRRLMRERGLQGPYAAAGLFHVLATGRLPCPLRIFSKVERYPRHPTKSGPGTSRISRAVVAGFIWRL